MMTIADMLARLEGLHSCGRYVARCPGHADLARQVGAVSPSGVFDRATAAPVPQHRMVGAGEGAGIPVLSGRLSARSAIADGPYRRQGCLDKCLVPDVG